MSTVIPQPLNGNEIKKGIAVRMTRGLPDEIAEQLREKIITGLGKTCSLIPSAAYSKFKADWQLIPESGAWWVDYELDDFGRVTKGGIGANGKLNAPSVITGHIDEVPPDRFRRETDQPIPKSTELKPDAEKSTLSRSIRGQGKRRQV